MGEELESARKQKDVIYRLMDRRELEELWHHVNGILVYLKQVYGESFERFPEVIGDREQRAPCANPVLLEVLDRALRERQYDILFLTFLLFFSKLQDMQLKLADEVTHKESYYDWLRALHERSDRFLGGTGPSVEEFISTACIQYVERTPIFLTTHRKQPMLEGHRE